MERMDVQKLSEKPMQLMKREFVSELEPDPEFSRFSTEETKSQTSALLKKNSKEATPRIHPANVLRFIEDQPAVAASALVAMTSAIIALRKSL